LDYFEIIYGKDQKGKVLETKNGHFWEFIDNQRQTQFLCCRELVEKSLLSANKTLEKFFLKEILCKKL